MKYVSEYRDKELVGTVLEQIREVVTKPWTIMEICGGQTHAIVRYGLDQLLPEEIELVHGPGCPVCVTPLELIDKALVIASQPEVIFASYGDMLRVPGSNRDLFSVRATGGDVRVVYPAPQLVGGSKGNLVRSFHHPPGFRHRGTNTHILIVVFDKAGGCFRRADRLKIVHQRGERTE